MIDDDLGFFEAGHAGLVEVALDHAHARRDMSGAWQARLLRFYLAQKVGDLTTSVRGLEDGLSELDRELVAIANAARSDDRRAIRALRDAEGDARALRLDSLRERGRALLAAYPDLLLGRFESGPPRALELPDPVSEMGLEILVDDVLRGAVDLPSLSHHVLMAVLARLERRKKAAEAAEVERRRLNATPVRRGDIYGDKDFYRSMEWQMFLAAIAAVEAAVTSAAASTWQRN